MSERKCLTTSYKLLEFRPYVFPTSVLIFYVLWRPFLIKVTRLQEIECASIERHKKIKFSRIIGSSKKPSQIASPRNKIRVQPVK